MSFLATGEGGLAYDPCRYGRSKLLFRGPRRHLDGPYCAVLGGSETYGRFVERPYPAVIEAATGMTMVNFGCVNSGPDVFLGDPDVMAACRQARVTTIQLTGAHNMSNPFYTVHPRRNDRFLSASGLMTDMFPGIDFTEFHFTRHMLITLRERAPVRYAELTAALKTAWVVRMTDLITRIGGPVVLLWLCARDETGDDAACPVPDAVGEGCGDRGVAFAGAGDGLAATSGAGAAALRAAGGGAGDGAVASDHATMQGDAHFGRTSGSAALRRSAVGSSSFNPGSMDRAAMDRAAMDRAAMDRAAMDRAGPDRNPDTTVPAWLGQGWRVDRTAAVPLGGPPAGNATAVRGAAGLVPPAVGPASFGSAPFGPASLGSAPFVSAPFVSGAAGLNTGAGQPVRSLGDDPLLVDREMVAELRAYATELVRVCVRPHGLAGKVFAPLEAPLAAVVPGPDAHNAVASALAKVLVPIMQARR